MRICCQDLFFARARSTDAAHTLVNSKTPLENAFQHVTTMSERTNVVSELLNIKVSSINDTDYSPQVCRASMMFSVTLMIIIHYFLYFCL